MDRTRTVFVSSAFAILLTTALAKLAELLSGQPYLNTPAPLFPELTWREMLILAAVIEICASLLVLRHRKSQASMWAILWVGALFGSYRALLLLVGYHGPCNCLGVLRHWLPFSGHAENITTLLVLGYLFSGSALSLLLSRRDGAPVLPSTCLLLLLASIPESSAVAEGYRVVGEQVVFAEYQGVEQQVQRTTFEAVCLRSNWQLTLTYPQTGAVDCYAVVSGVAYLTSGSTTSPHIAGGAMEQPIHMLAAMTEAGRVTFVALLYTPEVAQALGESSLSVAPFLPPRYPAMQAYVCTLDGFKQYPHLPEKMRWTLDSERLGRVPEKQIEYYFGSSRLGRKALNRFADSQREPAIYSVLRSTNAYGLVLPCTASVVHHYYDDDGKSGRRRFELSAAVAGPVGELDLRPTLRAGSRVTQVVDGNTYLYTSTDGQWLAAGDAKKVGRLVKAAPKQGAARRDVVGVGRVLIMGLLVLAPAALIYFSVQQRKAGLNHKPKHTVDHI